MAEYRLNPAENNNKGVIIWHANATIKNGGFIDKKNYIKPIYKNEGKRTTDITGADLTRYVIPDDMYLKEDIWSSTTSPSSDFYNGYKTGAYLEVVDMDEEKATVEVGFKDPDIRPEPVIKSITTESPIAGGKTEVAFNVTYENFGELAENIWDYVDFITTGTVKNVSGKGYKTNGNILTISISQTSGDGEMQIRIKPGSAKNGFYTESKGSELSPVITIDNTPPELTLNGDKTVYFAKGSEYIEYGATATDNLDPNVQITIDTSEVDMNKADFYTVTYTASDHVGNKKYAYRTVKVVTPVPYAVKLYTNGGVLESALTQYMYGIGAQLPIPTRAGYSFDGWYDNAELDGASIESIPSSATGKKTFYAKWTPQQYTITFDYDEATGGNTVLNKDVIYNENYGELPIPAKVGFVFDSWQTADGTEVSSETVVSTAQDHTLYAKWAECNHADRTGTVTLNSTCSVKGVKTLSCLICKKIWTEAIATLPHTAVIDKEVSPTCETVGKTEGSHCSVCGAVIKAQYDVPALGHNWQAWNITVKPTESATGIAERGCVRFRSHIDTVTLPVLTDTSVWTAGERTEPSETENGSQKYTSEYGTVTVTLPAKPAATPSPTPTVEPTASPTPTPTAKPTATPTVELTASPSPSPTTTPTASPTPEPSDRVEFERQADGTVLADIIFEKTTPPKQDDIQLIVAYRENGQLRRVEMPKITDMTASFVIPKGFEDCEISVYVWDKDMKPLMRVQNVNIDNHFFIW